MMDFNKFFDDIKLGDTGRRYFEKIEAKRMSEPKFATAMERCFDEFYSYEKCKRGVLFSECLEKIADEEGLIAEELNFYVCLCCSDRIVEEYKAMGLDLNLFYATVNREIVQECELNYDESGIYGIPAYKRRWTRRAIHCKLFKIGRLTYEIAESKHEVKIGDIEVKVGDPCLSVHIPKGNFDEAACEESYAMAREFYSSKFGLNPVVFFCYSWLLQPWLLDVLPSDSNIAKFQKKYKSLDFVEDPGDVIRWVYPQACENAEDYPEDTSIQRATKKRLLNGEIIGYGVGVRL